MAISVLNGFQLALAFLCGFASSFMHRRTFLLVTEITRGISGLCLCIYPTFFLQMIDFEKALNITLDHGHQLIAQILGGFSCGFCVLSVMTRQRSNDEHVARTLMSMWTQLFGLDLVVWIKIVSGFVFLHVDDTVEATSAGTPDTSSTTNTATSPPGLFDISMEHLAYGALIFGVFLASVIQLVRWPLFRAQISMTTDNRVNLHVFVEELETFLFGTIFLIYPELMLDFSGLGTDDLMVLSHRIMGMLLIVVAIYAHNIQSYFNDFDKAPFFCGLLLVQLTQLIHIGVHSYVSPGHLAFSLPLTVIWLVCAAIHATNRVLGLLLALNDGDNKWD